MFAALVPAFEAAAPFIEGVVGATEAAGGATEAAGAAEIGTATAEGSTAAVNEGQSVGENWSLKYLKPLKSFRTTALSQAPLYASLSAAKDMGVLSEDQSQIKTLSMEQGTDQKKMADMSAKISSLSNVNTKDKPDLAWRVQQSQTMSQIPEHARTNQTSDMTRVPEASQPQVSVNKSPSLDADAEDNDTDVYIAYNGSPVSYFDNINQQRGESLLAQAEYAIQQLKSDGVYQNAKRVYHVSDGSKMGDEIARSMASKHNEVDTLVL